MISQSAHSDQLLSSSNMKRKRSIDEDPAPELKDKTAGPSQSQERGGDQQSALDTLCLQCTKLPLQAIFSDQKPKDSKRLLNKFKPAGTWTETSCPLCRILGTTLPPAERDDSAKVWKLDAYSNAHRGKPWTTMEASVMLRLSSSGFPHDAYVVHLNKDSPAVRHVASDRIDYTLLKDWMRFCEQKHDKSCRKRGPDVPFLRLIDCQSRKLVPAERHRYAALSYLWGKPGTEPASQTDIEARREQLPSCLPATIEDAILVTKNLGLQYLWIDRYCINQKEKREVDEQIRQMDLVYQNAEVTIIAAAGNDPSHGLPGVRSRKRLPQCRVEVNGHVLAQSLMNPQLAILQSAWWTRGWTFQEGLLARRRLVFTDEQVYFECDSMYCCEALDVNPGRLEDLHTKGTQVFRRKYSTGSGYITLHTHTLGAFPRGVIGQKVKEIVQFISDYSCRCFTNPGDKLKGFLGVLRAMYTEHGIQHFWGTPIIPSKFAAPRRSRSTVARQACLHSNNPPATFLAGVCWKLVYPGKRIRSLPSWSWVGWEGIVETGWGVSAYREDGPLRSDPDVEIRFMDRDGQILTWENFQDKCQDVNLVQALSPCIQITTWVAKATVLKQVSGFASNPEYQAMVEAGNGDLVHWTFMPDTQNQLKIGQTYTCLYVGLYTDYPSETWGVDVLIVDEVDGSQGCFERIGAGFLRGTPELRFPNDALQRAQFEDKIAMPHYWRPYPSIWKERATIRLR